MSVANIEADAGESKSEASVEALESAPAGLKRLVPVSATSCGDEREESKGPSPARVAASDSSVSTLGSESEVESDNYKEERSPVSSLSLLVMDDEAVDDAQRAQIFAARLRSLRGNLRASDYDSFSDSVVTLSLVDERSARQRTPSSFGSVRRRSEMNSESDTEGGLEADLDGEVESVAADGEERPGPLLCEICFARNVETDWVFCTVCNYSVCMTCSMTHVESQVSRTGRALCLNWRCSADIPDSKLEALLNPPQLQKLYRLRDRRAADKHECPQCNEFTKVERRPRRFVCSHCDARSCGSCKRPWGRTDCRLRLCSPEPTEFHFWRMGKNVRHCPKCRNVIEKNGGCPHMTCVWCGHEFMWCCKQPYGSHDPELCLAYSVMKNRNPVFGPTKPVRAVTKSTALVVGGVGMIAAGAAYGVLYYVPVKGGKFVYRSVRNAMSASS